MEYPSLIELLKAGAHFGHRASRWHPKMEPYIFGTRNDVHIIDLEKTLAELIKASEYVRDLVAAGGSIVFVGTKSQAQEIIKRVALDCGMPYVCGRWLGGTLTNWIQLHGRVRYYLDLKKKQETGELQKYTKKEQLLFSREVDDLGEKFDGVATLERMPQALFVIDVKHEKTAVSEANQTNVPVVALCDTNVDPAGVAYRIPGNDDAVRSIELFTKAMGEAVKEGKLLAAARAKDAQAKIVAQTVAARP